MKDVILIWIRKWIFEKLLLGGRPCKISTSYKLYAQYFWYCPYFGFENCNFRDGGTRLTEWYKSQYKVPTMHFKIKYTFEEIVLSNCKPIGVFIK